MARKMADSSPVAGAQATAQRTAGQLQSKMQNGSEVARSDKNYVQPPLQLVHDFTIVASQHLQQLPPVALAAIAISSLPVVLIFAPILGVFALPWLLAAALFYTAFFGWAKASQDVKESVNNVYHVKLENVAGDVGNATKDLNRRLESYLSALKESSQKNLKEFKGNGKGWQGQANRVGHQLYHQTLVITHAGYTYSYEVATAFVDVLQRLLSFGGNAARQTLAQTRDHPVTKRAEELGRETTRRVEEVARDVSRRVDDIVNGQRS